MKIHLNIWALCLRVLLCAGLFFISCPVVYAVANFTIGWDPNTEEDLDGYGIYVSKGTPGPPYEHFGDVFLDELSDLDNPQVTLTEFDDGTYYIAATAFDNQGNESEFSKKIEVEVSGSKVTHIAPSEVGGGGGGGGG